MDNAAILDVRLTSDTDTVHISAYNRIEPDAAIVAYHDVTYDGGIRCNKYISSKTGRHALNGENYGHSWRLCFTNLRD
jgi:hypothetical protein